jgi:hypothetical protein
MRVTRCAITGREGVMESESFLTVGEIARRLNLPLHRIEYVIRSRRIQPTGWAGHARVFGQKDLDTIAAELSRISAARNEATGMPIGGAR